MDHPLSQALGLRGHPKIKGPDAASDDDGTNNPRRYHSNSEGNASPTDVPQPKEPAAFKSRQAPHMTSRRVTFLDPTGSNDSQEWTAPKGPESKILTRTHKETELANPLVSKSDLLHNTLTGEVHREKQPVTEVRLTVSENKGDRLDAAKAQAEAGNLRKGLVAADTLRAAYEEHNHLRGSRDYWKTAYEACQEEKDQLEAEIAQLRDKALPVIMDSDGEELPLHGTRARKDTAAGLTATTRTNEAKGGFNKKYADVPTFRGEEDRDTGESWSMHLQSKFHASATLFPTERAKIDYIRDHCKGTAFEIFKTGAKANSEKPYDSAEAVMGDPELVFGDIDVFSNVMAKLDDPDFRMGAKRKHSTPFWHASQPQWLLSNAPIST